MTTSKTTIPQEGRLIPLALQVADYLHTAMLVGGQNFTQGLRDASKNVETELREFINKKPITIYSKARAEWLEKAASQLKDIEGDDDWVDWMAEGKRLEQEGE